MKRTQSTDDIKNEIDALVQRCTRLPNDEERRNHIASCNKQLIEAGWTPHEAKFVTKGALWILDLSPK